MVASETGEWIRWEKLKILVDQTALPLDIDIRLPVVTNAADSCIYEIQRAIIVSFIMVEAAPAHKCM